MLVDGFVAGTWSAAVAEDEATLTVAAPAAEDVEAEGLGLLALIAPDARERRVVFSR